MARLRRTEPSSDDEDGNTRTDSTHPHIHDASLSPSPESFSSDKENRTRPSTASSKRKSNDMESSSAVTTPNSESSSAAASKKRRLGERSSSRLARQSAEENAVGENDDKAFYDPDQDEGERRLVRKGLRDLTKDLNDSRSEYLQSDSRGIAETLEKANELYKSVKQTSDATIDSRLLVSAADLSYKKTTQLALGDASAGLDVDEFVSKCISFMRQGLSPDQPGDETQRGRQRGRTQNDDEDRADGEGDDGDMMNWDWLGRQACFPHNLRPPVCGFLLGPLSLQKKVRQFTQRRAREARRNPADATRPEEIEAEELERRESSNLITICANIRRLLGKCMIDGQALAENEVTEKMTQQEVLEVMDMCNIASTGGVPLFKFCINPKSFGQTVENLFYVSFLVKEGKVGLEMDERKLPTLVIAGEKKKDGDDKELPTTEGHQRRQAVFNLDFATWHSLIEVFDIKESLIPHRAEETVQYRNGWYG